MAIRVEEVTEGGGAVMNVTREAWFRAAVQALVEEWEAEVRSLRDEADRLRDSGEQGWPLGYRRGAAGAYDSAAGWLRDLLAEVEGMPAVLPGHTEKEEV